MPKGISVFLSFGGKQNHEGDIDTHGEELNEPHVEKSSAAAESGTLSGNEVTNLGTEATKATDAAQFRRLNRKRRVTQ
jgi:hypothetical protein